MTRWISFALLLAVIIGVAALFIRVMAGFLLPLFLAAILVVMFRPLHKWMLKKMPGRDRLAAVLTTAAIALIVLAPMGLVTTLAAIEASSLIAGFNDSDINLQVRNLRESLGLEYDYAEELRYLESSLETMRNEALQGATAKGDCTAIERLIEVVQRLGMKLHDGPNATASEDLMKALVVLKTECDGPQYIGTLDYQEKLVIVADKLHDLKILLLGGEFKAWLKELVDPTAEEIRSLTEQLFAGAPGFLRSVGGATTSFLGKAGLGLGVLLLAVYFFLTDGPKMVSTLMRLSPLDDRHERELVDEFDRISRAVVVATLLSAVVQGLLAGFGFWLAGVGSVFLLMLLTILFALVPFVGAATVWIPVSLGLFFYADRPVAAVLLAIYGAAVVSMADNVIKPLVLHGQSNLHPLLALLSVLGGVQVLGPIGILVGPMVVVFLQTLLNILQRELSSLDQKVKEEGA